MIFMNGLTYKLTYKYMMDFGVRRKKSLDTIPIQTIDIKS